MYDLLYYDIKNVAYMCVSWNDRVTCQWRVTRDLRGSCVGLRALLYKILHAQTEKDHKIFKLLKIVKMEATSQSEPPSKTPNNHSQESNGRR